MDTTTAFMLNESGFLLNVHNAYVPAMAHDLWDRECRAAWWHRLTSSLRGRSCRLAELSVAISGRSIVNRHYAGLYTVSISRIVGSENRAADFDAAFRPLNARSGDRWQSIARARLEGWSLPPVELIQVGDEYFVRDGHHRISVARALGEDFVEARVTVWKAAGAIARGERPAHHRGNEWLKI